MSSAATPLSTDSHLSGPEFGLLDLLYSTVQLVIRLGTDAQDGAMPGLVTCENGLDLLLKLISMCVVCVTRESAE